MKSITILFSLFLSLTAHARYLDNVVADPYLNDPANQQKSEVLQNIFLDSAKVAFSKTNIDITMETSLRMIKNTYAFGDVFIEGLFHQVAIRMQEQGCIFEVEKGSASKIYQRIPSARNVSGEFTYMFQLLPVVNDRIHCL